MILSKYFASVMLLSALQLRCAQQCGFSSYGIEHLTFIESTPSRTLELHERGRLLGSRILERSKRLPIDTDFALAIAIALQDALPSDRAGIAASIRAMSLSASADEELIAAVNGIYADAISAVQRLTKYSERDNPDPRVHLALALAYRSIGQWRDTIAASKAYVAHCPDDIYLYFALRFVPAEYIPKELKSQLRAALERATGVNTVKLYPTLWKLESTNNDERVETFRNRITRDLERIAERVPADGYQKAIAFRDAKRLRDGIVSDTDLVSWAERGEFVRAFQAWKRDHPRPGASADSVAKGAYLEVLGVQAERWLEDFPEHPELARALFTELSVMGEASVGGIQAMVKALLAANRTDIGYYQPSLALWAAALLARHELEPDRVRKLVTAAAGDISNSPTSRQIETNHPAFAMRWTALWSLALAAITTSNINGAEEGESALLSMLSPTLTGSRERSKLELHYEAELHELSARVHFARGQKLAALRKCTSSLKRYHESDGIVARQTKLITWCDAISNEIGDASAEWRDLLKSLNIKQPPSP